jgi:hypothetical protein
MKYFIIFQNEKQEKQEIIVKRALYIRVFKKNLMKLLR